MKLLTFFLLLTLSQIARSHEMQHGFIISPDDSFFSHLVATGHHSHQLSFSGELIIEDSADEFSYQERKITNAKTSYFLFQAQKLNLPAMKNNETITGHIIESPLGDYTPQNQIVRKAKIKVKHIHINVINPFFGDSQ